MEIAELVLDVLFIAATVCASAFPLLYLVLPWRSTPQGRAIQHFAIGMAVLMNLTLLFKVWYPENYWVVWGIVFAALVYVTWAAAFRTWVLLNDIRRHWNNPTHPTVPTDMAGNPEA